MRRRTVPVLAAVGAAAAVAAAVGVAASTLDRKPEAATSVENTRPPGEVSSYWTEERMEEATGG